MGIRYLSHDFRCVAYNFLLGLDILSKNWGILDNKGNSGRKFASYPGSLFFPSPEDPGSEGSSEEDLIHDILAIGFRIDGIKAVLRGISRGK